MLEGHANPESFISDAFLTFLNSTQDLVFLKDENLVYTAASNSFAALVGRRSGAELEGKTDFDLFADQELAKRYREDDLLLMKKGEPLLDYIEPMPGKDGRYAYSSTSKYLVRNASGKVIGMWGIARDVTREYEARLHYERELQHLFELPEDALSAAMFDITGWRVVDIRSKIGRTSAISYYETVEGFVQHMNVSVVEGDEASVFFHSFSAETLHQIYDSGKRHFSLEYLRRMPDGHDLWVRSEFHFLQDPINFHLTLLVTLLDIDAEHRSRDTLTRAAERDAMTNLLNREATMRRIEEFLQGEGAQKKHALFLIDLDNFKQVNDTFGHQMGDTVIVQVAGLLRNNFRETDIVGRIGGDEFFALMKDLDELENVQSKAQSLVSTLQYVCATPKAKVELSSSVGISVSTNGDKPLAQLYAEADEALYDAKRAGKNCYAVYRSLQEIAAAQDAAPEAGAVISTVNLHTLLNRIDAGVIIFRAKKGEIDPTPVFFSDSLLTLMGGLTRQEATELYSRDVFGSIHPDDLQRVNTEYRNAFTNNVPLRTTFRKRGKNNAYFWVSVGSTVTRHDDGSFDLYSVYTSTDSLMQAEAELREKNRILELAMKNTDINVWFWDMRTRVCTLTPNCAAVHGMPVETLDNFPECLVEMGYIREDCIEDFLQKFAELEQGAPEVLCDAWYTRRGDMGEWCERVAITAVRDDKGVPLRAIGIGKNVTVMKEFEQKYHAVKSGLRPLVNSVGSCIVNLSKNRCIEAEGCAVEVLVPNEKSTADSFFVFLQGQVLRKVDLVQAQIVFSREALLTRYARGKSDISLEYLARGYGDTFKWLRTTAEMLENPETGDVEAIVYCVDIDEEKRMQLTMEKLLATDYELLCQIDAASGKFIMFGEKAGTKMIHHDCTNLYYDTTIQSVLRAFVADEAIDQGMIALSRETLLRELSGKILYTCTLPNKAVRDSAEGYRQWRFSYLDETRSVILITRTDVTELFFAELDPLTGLYNRQAFYRYVTKRLAADPQQRYVIVRHDLDRFKAFNDAYGSKAGDKLLHTMAQALRASGAEDNTLWGRLDADHFVALSTASEARIEEWCQRQAQWLEAYSPSFRLTSSVGAYIVTERDIDVSLMCDRALLALKTVKDRYETAMAWYDDSLRQQLMAEQALIDETADALQQEQFVVYYQPQVNYATGALIGAEALVRWVHPQRGMISPGNFVPLFEKNGFISRLDEYVWEKVCLYMRTWSSREQRAFPVPISVNISRINLYDQTLCDRLAELVDRYDIPRDKLRLEITESAYMDNPQQLIGVVKCLREMGFTIEMDDFGSGYSSLNTLKDVPVDVLKLDVRFLSSGEDNARGGNILSSVIRMAHWLKVPVVAEGVETKSQADYLKSLSCFYMQGYYFDRPMPEADFTQMLGVVITDGINYYAKADLDGVAAFWDPSAQNTLLFNSFVGGAIIVEYHNGAAELLRANDNFFEEIGSTREAYLSRQFDVLSRFEPSQRARYEGMLRATVETGEETECELKSLPLGSGAQVGWTNNRARLLAKNEDRYLIYVSVQNITRRKKMEEQLLLQQAELQIAVSQMGALVCRYDVANKTLQLPEEYAQAHGLEPVLENVPDSILPLIAHSDRAVYEKMYADIHNGVRTGRATVQFLAEDKTIVSQEHIFTTVFDSAQQPARAIICVQV